MSPAKVVPLRARAERAALDPRTPPREDAPAPSDEALLARVAEDDRAALGALFDRHAERLAAFLHRLGHTRDHEVDDLVQDTFLAVARGAGDYRGGAAVRTWIFAVGANVARDRARSASRFAAMRVRLARWVLGEETARPDRALDAAEEIARVRAAIAALPHDQRVAFVLCDVEEQPGVEVAASLGVPTGTLYRRLFEARKRVKAALGGPEGEP